MSPFRQTTVSGFPAIVLRGEELEVVVVPAVGMKLTNLRRLRGREWLWRNDQLPLALAVLMLVLIVRPAGLFGRVVVRRV